MITSNIMFEDMEKTEIECPICGATNDEIQWKAAFWGYAPEDDDKEPKSDFFYDAYYYCNECGYFYRDGDSDLSGHFLPYKVEGISIMGPWIKAYRQLNLLRLHHEKAEKYKLLDHRQYKPYLRK